MIAVIQRVKEAMVSISGEDISRIGQGMVVLVGVSKLDSERDPDLLAEKIAMMRIFPDENGKMNRSLLDIHGEALIVSQFTLVADVWSGRRPSFTAAASPPAAKPLFDRLVDRVKTLGIPVKTGVFGAMMEVTLTNDGPVTIIMDTRLSRSKIKNQRLKTQIKE
jgi:D-tyrosyl-tRNA(Tyr) deacylase